MASQQSSSSQQQIVIESLNQIASNQQVTSIQQQQQQQMFHRPTQSTQVGKPRVLRKLIVDFNNLKENNFDLFADLKTQG